MKKKQKDDGLQWVNRTTAFDLRLRMPRLDGETEDEHKARVGARAQQIRNSIKLYRSAIAHAMSVKVMAVRAGSRIETNEKGEVNVIPCDPRAVDALRALFNTQEIKYREVKRGKKKGNILLDEEGNPQYRKITTVGTNVEVTSEGVSFMRRGVEYKVPAEMVDRVESKPLRETAHYELRSLLLDIYSPTWLSHVWDNMRIDLNAKWTTQLPDFGNARRGYLIVNDAVKACKFQNAGIPILFAASQRGFMKFDGRGGDVELG